MTTNADTVTASTQNFSLKSEITETGEEKEFIQGFVATTHLDKGNDQYTVDALKGMAEDINTDTVEAVFNDVDQEELREAQVGNLDHNNNPASPFGDTRTVPAFKIQKAEVRDTPDGEKGLYIKAMLNNDGMLPETVSAVKNSIKQGFLDSFSIEYIPEKVKRIKENDKVIRLIEAAKAKGAALTGRPMNPMAQLTDAQLKSMADEYITESKKDDTTMTDDTEPSEEEPETEPEEEVSEETESKAEDEGEPEEEEVEESGEGQDEEDTKSFSEDIDEIRETVSEVKSVNDELREQNEELKSELDDLRQLQEIKSEVDEVKTMLEDVDLEDGPRAKQEQKRFDEDQETKAEWKQSLDRLGADYLKSEDYVEAFAENHGIDSQEVKNYVNSD